MKVEPPNQQSSGVKNVFVYCSSIFYDIHRFESVAIKKANFLKTFLQTFLFFVLNAASNCGGIKEV